MFTGSRSRLLFSTGQKSSTEETPAALATQDSSNGATRNKHDDDSGIPQKAIVLPLYSMQSTEGQAQEFVPVP